jgi:16S rRNA U1498 N3-methylase RsmE
MSRTPRVFVAGPLAAGARITLEGEAAAHLGRVLRVRAGEAVVLFDGSGPEFAAEVRAATRRAVELDVGVRHEVERESALDLALLQGVCRNERMDWVVRKATELGVRAIRPVLTERSVVKLDAARAANRLEHWRAIAVSACEQCGRNVLPEILAPCRSARRSRRTRARWACCWIPRRPGGRTGCRVRTGRCACWWVPRAGSTSASAPRRAPPATRASASGHASCARRPRR